MIFFQKMRPPSPFLWGVGVFLGFLLVAPRPCVADRNPYFNQRQGNADSHKADVPGASGQSTTQGDLREVVDALSTQVDELFQDAQFATSQSRPAPPSNPKNPAIARNFRDQLEFDKRNMQSILSRANDLQEQIGQVMNDAQNLGDEDSFQRLGALQKRLQLLQSELGNRIGQDNNAERQSRRKQAGLGGGGGGGSGGGGAGGGGAGGGGAGGGGATPSPIMSAIKNAASRLLTPDQLKKMTDTAAGGQVLTPNKAPSFIEVLNSNFENLKNIAADQKAAQQRALDSTAQNLGSESASISAKLAFAAQAMIAKAASVKRKGGDLLRGFLQAFSGANSAGGSAAAGSSAGEPGGAGSGSNTPN